MYSRFSFAFAAAAFSLLLIADAKLENTHRSNITLVNNGYEGILIAIGEDVSPEYKNKILTKLEIFFGEASKTLYVATNKRVYFRNITVLLPKSWKENNKNYAAAKTETFAKANIVIDGPGLDTPTTWTYENCGKPGEFIQIPTQFITAPLSTVARYFGSPGKTIVHEWGHLRWGLRDEYPLLGQKQFYHDSNNQVAAVKCGKHMKGSWTDDITKGSCSNDTTTGLPSNTCRFKEDDSPGVKASLMFHHDAEGVETFCDNDESNPETLHNDESPNQHNDVCGGRSAWEVMRGHEDFLGVHSRTLADEDSPKPSFHYVQAQNKRIVMILDVSGSMRTTTNGVSRLQKLHHASDNFLMRVVQQNMSVGLVTFNSSATTLVGLTEITCEGDRQKIVDRLPIYAIGGTAIGKGLLQGVKLLEDSGETKGGILVVVTDGGENVEPYVNTTRQQLIDKGVTMHVILITDKAEKKLIPLAASTGGKVFYDSGTVDSTDLQSALRSIVSEEESSLQWIDPVDLIMESISIGTNMEINRTVNIDSSVGRDTEFTFSYAGSRTLDVAVMSPNGAVYRADGPHSDSSKTVTISIQNETEVGLWTIILKNTGQSTTVTHLLVTSKSPSDDIYPIRARAFLSQQTIDFDDSSAIQLVVRAQVKKGYTPVIGAKVEVQVGTMPWKLMKDDGLGVDVVKDDGYYSLILFDFTNDGTFTVKIRAAAKDGNETRLVTGSGTRAYRLAAINGSDEHGPIYQTVDPFDRIADAGLINVVNVKSPAEMRSLYPFPPPKVKDLKATEMSYENKTVTLQWTSVGDFAEQETASSYDIRYSRDIKELRNSFENASQLTDADMMSGNLTSPLPPSETETTVICFPGAYVGQTLFFGVKVNHSANRVSDVSNIVSAAIVYIPPEAPSTTSAANSTSTPEPEVTPIGISAQALLAIKWTFAIGVPVLFVIALALAIKVVRRGNNEKETKHAGRPDKSGNNNRGLLPYIVTRTNSYVSGPRSGRESTSFYQSHLESRQERGYLAVPIGGWYYSGNNYHEPEPDY